MDVAEAAGYVIMPVGCPVCIVSEDMRAGLPEEFRAAAVVVESGRDILSVLHRN